MTDAHTVSLCFIFYSRVVLSPWKTIIVIFIVNPHNSLLSGAWKGWRASCFSFLARETSRRQHWKALVWSAAEEKSYWASARPRERKHLPLKIFIPLSLFLEVFILLLRYLGKRDLWKRKMRKREEIVATLHLTPKNLFLEICVNFLRFSVWHFRMSKYLREEKLLTFHYDFLSIFLSLFNYCVPVAVW